MDPVSHINSQWTEELLLNLQECIATAVDTRQRLETMGHTMSILTTQVQLLTSKQRTTTPSAAWATSAVVPPPAPSAARPTRTFVLPSALQTCTATAVDTCQKLETVGQAMSILSTQVQLLTSKQQTTTPSVAQVTSTVVPPPAPSAARPTRTVVLPSALQECIATAVDTCQRLETMGHTMSILSTHVQLLTSTQQTTTPLLARATSAVIPPPALSTPVVFAPPALLAARPTPAVHAPPAPSAARPTPAVLTPPAHRQPPGGQRLICHQTPVCPSTTATNDKGKRKLDLQGVSSNWQSPTKRRRNDTEKFILSEVKNIMKRVDQRIPNKENKKLNSFLKTKISDLETDKRELVGVFGKTGAGKSSLINAVIGQKNLLPSGSINACTSVMIKMEANMKSSKYEADIEFITKEDWKDELFSVNFLGDNAAQENDEDEDYHDTVEKLSALYGEEWKEKSPEALMDLKYFREIPEFLRSKRKTLTCQSAQELSAKLVKYTRNDSQEGKEVKRWYWPLVKCVTVRVPNNDLLKHVTLVDLPGNGDRNKSRDEMWKGVVGSCSTVWIVTAINRAASEKESWEILEGTCSLVGNGGQCQQIHFICTKSDDVGGLDDHSSGGVQAFIFKRNMQAKEEVRKEFNKLINKRTNIKKHFSDDCLKVFTVSSKEFLNKKHLNPDETEIPKLQEFLQYLNDCHSETLNYVSGAYGILSLIQGARCSEVAGQKRDVCKILEEKMRHELVKVTKPMEEAYEAFEKCLNDGVEKSKSSCEKVLKSVLYPKGKTGSGFHGTLKCVVEHNGMHKSKKGKQINLNVALASCLTDSIDEEFKNTFPNERQRKPFKGAIDTFSLDTERLIQEYKDVELQLVFLKTEEEKIKTRLNKIIRERKKTIYSSLATTIERTMQECYEKAATFKGQDRLKNMQETIERQVNDSKNIMFQQAKDEMLTQLRGLKEDILKTLGDTMQKSIELSLQADGESIPDLSMELEEVKRYYNKLNGSPNEETFILDRR